MRRQPISELEAVMFNSSNLIRPHVLEMPAYEPILPFEVLSAQLGRSAEEIIKLDANENPYGPLPEVSQALAKLPYAHIYPDPESRMLRTTLAQYHNLPIENILAGAGADELIDLMLRLLIDPGDQIINCPPTFGMYAFDADLNRAGVVTVPRLSDYALDWQAIERAVTTRQPKLIFLCSPNNPDGSLVQKEQVLRLLDLPVIVVLDEAYIEFAAPGSSLIQEVPARQNLVVLRTFSKWAGLAGLRVGFGAFPSGLMEHLWKIKQPYNLSVAASTAARVSLEHAFQLQQIVQQIIAERQRLSTELAKIPWIKTYPSQANYVLCRVVGRDARLLKHELARQGILVRYFNKPGLQDHIRISVGKSEHTDRLISILETLE
jgi:histidinol-phosphate aminotransferase